MTPQNDLDETLTTPRFDAAEEESARPVEPLAGVGADGRRAQIHGFLQAQRRALRRSWPLALALCLLTAVVVGGTTALIHRHRAQAIGASPQTDAPAAVLPPNTVQPDNAFAPARPTQMRRGVSRTRRTRQAARPTFEYVITDEAEDEHERKKEHKHKGHGGDDEDTSAQPRKKRDARRPRAVLFDVIPGRDH
jgi:hypothetical protein